MAEGLDAQCEIYELARDGIYHEQPRPKHGLFSKLLLDACCPV